MKKINLKKYEGKCIGVANGKVVISSKDVNKVMKVLNNKYEGKEVLISSVPKKDKIFVL